MALHAPFLVFCDNCPVNFGHLCRHELFQYDLELFFVVMDWYRDERVFVHCVLNWRVSVFTFLYRVLRLGVSQEEAMETLLQIWQPNPVWRRFIDHALTQHGQELLA